MMGLGQLKFAMILTMALLFGTLAAIFGIFLYIFGGGLDISLGLALVVAFTLVMTGVQWYFGPIFIKWMTNMRELKRSDYPEIIEMVEEICKKTQTPVPKLFIVYDSTPNAFAFGRTPKDSNMAIHTGLLNVLNKEEVKAVIAHEVGHIKHWDVAVLTVASMVPILIYYMIVLFAGRSNEDKSFFHIILVYLGAILAQFLSSLIVRYLGRTRELYADAFSAVATGKPGSLRTALAKITYGFPHVNTELYASKRAFYIADPQTSSEISRELHKSESVEGFKLKPEEIQHAIEWEKTSGAARFGELFSTHPLTYKRINGLYAIEKEISDGKVSRSSV